MEIGQNSVHYDPETKELRVVTCYNKLQYKTLWVQDPFLRSMRYLLYTKDPEATGLPALRGFWVYFWVLRLMVLVAALYLLSRGLYYFSIPSGWFSGALMTGVSLALFFWVVRLRALWMRSYNKMVHRTKVSKAFRFTWEAIDQGFADRPVFRQEVVLTPEGYSLNTPYPGLPSFQCRRGEYFIRVVQDEGDVYFLQFKDRGSAKAGYISPAGLHFARSSYTDADWSCLLGALRELTYL